ncbi:MAG: hypothetical protein ACNA7Q_15285 [Rhodobacterales bacterium]
MTDAVLRPFDPADAPWLVERHATLYAQDEGFDHSRWRVARGLRGRRAMRRCSFGPMKATAPPARFMRQRGGS